MARVLDGLVRPSTRAWLREWRARPGARLAEFVHGYVYARWPYLYIGTATGRHPLARLAFPLARLLARLAPPPRPGAPTFADTYHGKVVPLDTARRLLRVEREIPLTDLEQVVPYTLAREIVLKRPLAIAVLECPCRSVAENPCLPLDVCLIVGEPFVSFIVEHHKGRSRRIGVDEAVEIIEQAHARGHVQHAFFKDAMLGRFYAICNCCSCCCGAMRAYRAGIPMLCASGYRTELDPDLCKGCGLCAKKCQFKALTLLSSGRVRVRDKRCMGCGVCVDVCPTGALRLVRDPAKGEPLEV
ncbi:MAG: 4Fe-4S binding protein [Desulfovibrionaceae bacterium]|jgi:ferredoxin|nr:4Fe-4S binding protein [Desulfovibrionaceae bacterium]